MNKQIYPLLILTFIGTCAFAQKFQKSALLKDIKTLPMPDSGKFVSVFYTTNENPEIIATHPLAPGMEMLANMSMSGKLEKGQVFTFGSSDYLSGKLLANQSIQQLLKNILNNSTHSSKKLKIAVDEAADPALSNFLKTSGAKVYLSKKTKPEPGTNVYFLTTDVTDTTEQHNLETFIRTGGLLVFGSPYPNIFKNRNKSKPYTNDLIKINDLLSKAGIFNAYTLIQASSNADTLTLQNPPFYLHLKYIIQQLADPGFKTVDPTEYAYGMEPTLELSFLSNADTSRVIQKLKSILSIGDTLAIPTIKKPLDISTPAKKAGYRFSKYLFDKKHALSDTSAFIYPESKFFPGEVPKNARRTTEQIEITVKVGTQGLLDPYSDYYRLHSTGCYVPAGEKISIVLDPVYKNQHLKGQIGIHNDDLKHMDNLVRAGFDLTRTLELNQDTTIIFSPYGGLLYIKIPDTSTLKSIKILASGVVKAPYYQLGKTTLADWTTIRNNPAPWAELATDNLILTIPSYRIKNLEHPDSLMKFWDEVMKVDADLAIINRKRVHPERIIIDEQVAYGYMFTQWDKIVAPNDESCPLMLDEKKLREKGSWGHFHELGHRHQFWGLDMDEVSEVTTNLYSMYVYDKVLKKGIYNHDAIQSKAMVREKIKEYLQNEPTFKKWGEDPFTALCMYIQLIENFGWESIISANKMYREKDPRKFYNTRLSNQERIDLWFTSISKATNANLSSFFDIWKIPVSGQAKAQVGMYKIWLPEELVSYQAH